MLTCIGERRLSAGEVNKQVRVRGLRNGFTERRSVRFLLHQTLKTRRFNEPKKEIKTPPYVTLDDQPNICTT